MYNLIGEARGALQVVTTARCQASLSGMSGIQLIPRGFLAIYAVVTAAVLLIAHLCYQLTSSTAASLHCIHCTAASLYCRERLFSHMQRDAAAHCAMEMCVPADGPVHNAASAALQTTTCVALGLLPASRSGAAVVSDIQAACRPPRLGVIIGGGCRLTWH
jgi:hypothetical protein